MKNKHFFLFLFLVFVLLVVYFFVIMRPVVFGPVSENDTEVDLIKLENDYKNDVKMVLDDFVLKINSSDFSVNDVSLARESFLRLKVPAELRDLHIALVMAVDKMDNYFASGDEREKTIGLDIINNAKEHYLWLK